MLAFGVMGSTRVTLLADLACARAVLDHVRHAAPIRPPAATLFATRIILDSTMNAFGIAGAVVLSVVKLAALTLSADVASALACDLTGVAVFGPPAAASPAE